jgi:hypothetical protein
MNREGDNGEGGKGKAKEEKPNQPFFVIFAFAVNFFFVKYPVVSYTGRKINVVT